jgi:hypothetical protein
MVSLSFQTLEQLELPSVIDRVARDAQHQRESLLVCPGRMDLSGFDIGDDRTVSSLDRKRAQLREAERQRSYTS